jgi:hypothetical protein
MHCFGGHFPEPELTGRGTRGRPPRHEPDMGHRFVRPSRGQFADAALGFLLG